ncbi:MAG: inorganic phosphate transporter [Phenylobacterium sp.]|uniref:inorganic phosphate transporter n=1 Tax=Phenylobacterium sp. TaxID=1871053 RepID=UPI0027321402|nr:inorganic phosphate transporter [Phenylobacterium sp.]MDP1615880.1 inorganic phosphate transporter [Phenylobacterium sp.]MDP3116289.1 inorganic phosphate transporter [Phenylobacterium sp.]
MAKTTLDKDLGKVTRLQSATQDISRQIALPGLSILFLVAVTIFATLVVADGPLAIYAIIGAVVAGYLALNIGANDVANNMGPAVGSKALPMAAALVIAGICEAAGAILAGGDVVATVSKGIITPPADLGTVNFILVMTAALFAAAVWINLATVIGAPVSTTHSIVGAVLGSGVAAAGFGVVAWPTLGAIAASWVISPVLGGLVAAGLLGLIKVTILFRQDRIAAARTWVPLLIALMSGVFTLYMLTKGLSRVWSPSGQTTLILAVTLSLGGWLAARPWVARRSAVMENRRKEVSRLFVLPLICAAALLSFAHGANDVANAVGPLAAIVSAAQTGSATTAGDVALPLWVLAIGALGISLGLALFGPRLIRTVGEKITKMDAIRAYCVAQAAAITVLGASTLGLPVSSTHIAIGGIFGVGLLREILTNRGVRRRPNGAAPEPTDPSLPQPPTELTDRQREKTEKRRLVRRRHAWSIAAAWVVTVPAAGLLAAGMYGLLSVLTRL